MVSARGRLTRRAVPSLRKGGSGRGPDKAPGNGIRGRSRGQELRSCVLKAREHPMRPSDKSSDWRSRGKQPSFASGCGRWVSGYCGGLGPTQTKEETTNGLPAGAVWALATSGYSVPVNGRNSDTPIDYSGRASLRREQYGTSAESQRNSHCCCITRNNEVTVGSDVLYAIRADSYVIQQ
jgi:hypothetical protein